MKIMEDNTMKKLLVATLIVLCGFFTACVDDDDDVIVKDSDKIAPSEWGCQDYKFESNPNWETVACAFDALGTASKKFIDKAKKQGE